MAVAPVDAAATLELARTARRLVIKAGAEVVRVDRTREAFSDADTRRHLVHDDGFLRVPVLILGDTLVRGYTETLYRDALGDVGSTA